MKELMIGIPIVLTIFAIVIYKPFLLALFVIGGLLLLIAYLVGCCITGKMDGS